MRYNNSKTNNLKMNDDTYQLRSEVMKLIYEAKEIVSLPRITVRITDNHPTMLGCALLEKDIIWITTRAIEEYDLRRIVYHEIAHAVFGTKHNDKCSLMKSSTTRNEKLTKSQCQRILKGLVV